MATITINKNDGIWIYDDYYRGRAALRLQELNATNPSQSIRRDRAADVETVLVSKDWYDTQVTAHASAPLFAVTSETKADDYMGYNLSTMVDLIVGRAQTKDQTSWVNAEGYTNDAFKIYELIDQKAFYVDNSDIISAEPTTKTGGTVLGYLLHSAHYEALGKTPVDTTYAGTGNGTLTTEELKPGGAVAETITLVAVNAIDFNVTGTVTGAMGTLTVGTVFETAQVKLNITVGGVAFVGGDQFTITSVAATV